MSDLKDIIQELSDQEGWDGTITLKLSSLSAGVRRAYGQLHGTPELEIDWDVLESLVSMNATISTLMSDPLATVASMDATIQTLSDNLPISTTELSTYIISLLDSVVSTIGAGAGIEVIASNTLVTTVNLDASIDGVVSAVISDSLVLADDPIKYWAKALSDLLFLYDDQYTGWEFTINDDLTIVDTQSIILGLILEEWLTLIDTQSNNWTGQEIALDTLNLYDLSIIGQNYSGSISDGLDISDVITYQFTVMILELLGFTELATAMKSMSASIAESIDVTDTADRGFGLDIADTLALIDTHSVFLAFLNSISDDLTVTDSNTLLNTINRSLSDSIVFVDSPTNTGVFYSAIYEALALNVTVELAGEVWETYVLNTPKFLPSIYSGFNFNSYCVFENRAFGANDLGIYELTGTTDSGTAIKTGVLLHSTDFGSPNQKKFRKGYLSLSGTAPKMILETDNGIREVYAIDTNGKVTISSGLKGKNWVLSVTDFDSIDQIKLIPVILTK